MAKVLGDAYSIEGIEYVSGKPVDVMGGGVYVIDFFATWCPPCMRSIPHMNEIATKYPDVGIVAVSNEAASKLANVKTKYSVASDPKGITQKYSRQYQITGIPCVLVIFNKKVVYKGHPMEDEFEEAILAARKAVAASAAASTSSEGKSNDADLIDFNTKTRAEIAAMSVSALQNQLKRRNVDYSDCIEKTDLVDRVVVKLGVKKDTPPAE